MSNERQETIADIVAKMRANNPLKYYPAEYGGGIVPNKTRKLADRFEAAWKREREAGAEAAQICGEIGEMIGREAACKQSVTDCNRLGDAAKMREAFENIADYAKAAACHTEDEHLLGYLNQIERWAEAALATPPRNCDRFATAKDAFAELDKLCEKTTCGYCRFRKYEGFECMFAWLFAEAKGDAK